jgi:hypothetical protein
VNEFEKNLPLIGELVTLCERMAGAGHVGTTLAELSERLLRPLSEIIRVFEVLNVQVASWSEPSLYRLNDIIEAGTRHEVSQRMG